MAGLAPAGVPAPPPPAARLPPCGWLTHVNASTLEDDKQWLGTTVRQCGQPRCRPHLNETLSGSLAATTPCSRRRPSATSAMYLRAGSSAPGGTPPRSRSVCCASSYAELTSSLIDGHGFRCGIRSFSWTLCATGSPKSRSVSVPASFRLEAAADSQLQATQLL